MTSTITFKTGLSFDIEYANSINMFKTPQGAMKPVQFFKWIKEQARQNCNHSDTLESNKGRYVKNRFGHSSFEKTNYKLCHTCGLKIN